MSATRRCTAIGDRPLWAHGSAGAGTWSAQPPLSRQRTASELRLSRHDALTKKCATGSAMRAQTKKPPRT